MSQFLEDFRELPCLAHPVFAREWRQLGLETDPALFFQGALGLADRLREGGELASAAELYAAIAALDSQPPPGPVAEAASRARSRLEALQGQGAFGARFEVLAGRFVRDATDYRMIVPMIAGSVVFQSVRAASLGRLLSGASAAWHRRGFGARLSAGLLGYAAEVPVFALSSRGLRDLGGEAVSWDGGSVAKDLAGAAITLAALKGSGYLTQRALQGAPSLSGRIQKFQHAALPQVAMFLGLMTAHRVEADLGLRPHVDGATAVTDTLASMFSLGVGSRLGHRVLGDRFARLQRALNLRAAGTVPGPLRLEPTPALAMSVAGHASRVAVPNLDSGPRVPVYLASSLDPKAQGKSPSGKAPEVAPLEASGETPPEPSLPPEAAGLRLRPYQGEYLKAAVEAMRKAASQGGRGPAPALHDRGYILSPFQTGKSLIIGPLAEAARDIFPGKQTLVLSPLKIVQSQVLRDLATTFRGRVSVFDAQQKKLDGEVVVASVYSLARFLKDADSASVHFQPERFGLVVVDELTYVLADSWRRILGTLGFVDGEGRPTRSRGKFALGLGGTGEREDGRHVREVFGDTFIAGRGLNWFVQEGYLHRVYGLEVPYGRSAEDSERVEDGAESLVAMRNTPENRRRILDTYEQYLGGKKAMVFVQSIQAAKDLEADFNARLGPAYAVAVTRETADRNVDLHTERFVSGEGAKVLIGVRRLAASFRALGVHGVIHGYQTASWNLFAQRSSRPLARQEGEAQRDVLIVTMEGRAMPLQRAQSAATLLGAYRKPPPGRVYRPGETEAGARGASPAKPPWSRKPLLAPGASKPAAPLQAETDSFARQIREVLRERFGGDVLRMSEQTKLRLAECDALLHGILPETHLEAVQLAKRLGISPTALGEAWLQDKAALLEATYPLPAEMGEAQRHLTRLFRKAVLLQASRGSMLSLVESGSISRTQYSLMRHRFRGQFPLQSQRLEEVYRWLLDSGVADSSTLRNAIGAYVVERGSGAKDREMRGEGAEEGFDPNYLDALDVAGNVKLSSLWGAEQPRLPPEAETPIEKLDAERLAESVQGVLSKLSGKKRRVLEMRYGLGEADPATLGKIAAMVGMVTVERIRQHELGALRKLRHPSLSRRLRDFYREESADPFHRPNWEGEMAAPLRSLGLSTVTHRLMLEHHLTQLGDLRALTEKFFRCFGELRDFVLQDVNRAFARRGWLPVPEVQERPGPTSENSSYIRWHLPLIERVEAGDKVALPELLGILEANPPTASPILLRLLASRRPGMILDAVLLLRRLDLPSDHHLWKVAQEYVLAGIAGLAPRYPKQMDWTLARDVTKEIHKYGTYRNPQLTLALQILRERGLLEAQRVWNYANPELVSLPVPEDLSGIQARRRYWYGAVGEALRGLSDPKSDFSVALLAPAPLSFPDPLPPVLVERGRDYLSITVPTGLFSVLKRALMSAGFETSEVDSSVRLRRLQRKLR
ncbi:MAG: DEAD/DEAH box helicase family protein [Deltaproteobacteria bacterium]|nr:DEAD/DEAH box helicase family protein [Deltaproteobacteria bacterium]